MGYLISKYRGNTLPHLYPIIVAQVIFDVPAVITIESVIYFIGLSVVNFPTWSNILGFAGDYLSSVRGQNSEFENG